MNKTNPQPSPSVHLNDGRYMKNKARKQHGWGWGLSWKEDVLFYVRWSGKASLGV